MEKLTAKELEVIEALKAAPLSFDNKDDEKTFKVCVSLEKKGLVSRETNEETGEVTFSLVKEALKDLPTKEFNGDEAADEPAKPVAAPKVPTLSLKKGEGVVLKDGRIGQITKYPSKAAITVQGPASEFFEVVVSFEEIAGKADFQLPPKPKPEPKKPELKVNKHDIVTIKVATAEEEAEGWFVTKYASNSAITLTKGAETKVVAKSEIVAITGHFTPPVATPAPKPVAEAAEQPVG